MKVSYLNILTHILVVYTDRVKDDVTVTYSSGKRGVGVIVIIT